MAAASALNGSFLSQPEQRIALYSRRPAARKVKQYVPAATLKGIEPPKEEPKLSVPFWGFTETAELWNARTAMVGILGITIVELFIGKGLLQTVGVEVGKGLNLPL